MFVTYRQDVKELGSRVTYERTGLGGHFQQEVAEKNEGPRVRSLAETRRRKGGQRVLVADGFCFSRKGAKDAKRTSDDLLLLLLLLLCVLCAFA